MNAPLTTASHNDLSSKLEALGITLPESKAPAGALYVPYTVTGKLINISGQLPLKEGQMTSTGQLGANVEIEEAQEAAKTCAINVLAAINAACGGDLSKVKKVLKLEILVSSAPGFNDPHVVANGASQLFIDLFGDDVGRHARVAYGVASLPMGASVEVAALAEMH